MLWLETNFIWFVIYSIAGWIWEVIICSIPKKQFINRGFLNGPYCPIYGAGAMLMIIVLGEIENPAVIFLAGSLLACSLEYISSWAMEKLFHARWWDYSKRFLNINGRVCLLGAVAFGTLGLVAVKFVHPTVREYTFMLPELAISIIALVLFTLMLIDLVYTLTSFSSFNAKLKELNDKLSLVLESADEQRKAVSEKLHSREPRTKRNLPHSELFHKFNAQELRLIKAFPKLRSNRYSEALEKIKQYLNKK